jgi:hypothetical protein
MTFPRSVLDKWDSTAEIEIETSAGEGARVHRTTIWIVVDGDSAFVRSVRGPEGRWWRELSSHRVGAVHAGGERTPVVAAPATDPESIERVNQALKRKYERRWAGPTASMLQPNTLPTTLRLSPA